MSQSNLFSPETLVEPMQVFVRLKRESNEHSNSAKKASGSIVKKTASFIDPTSKPTTAKTAMEAEINTKSPLKRVTSSASNVSKGSGSKSAFDKGASAFDTNGVRVVDDKTVRLVKPNGSYANEKEYIFDQIFTESTPHDDIYSNVSNHIKSAVDGYSATIFAYGSIMSGKTYTMSGIRSDPGLIQRGVKEMFQTIESNRLADPYLFYYVEMTMVELYNNNFKNLLRPSPSFFNSDITGGVSTVSAADSEQNAAIDAQFESSVNYPKFQHVYDKADRIDIHESPHLGIFLSGNHLRIHVRTAEEALILINRGNKLRTTRPGKAMKYASNKSHTILTFHIESRKFDENAASDSDSELIMGKLQFVDMAGNEKLGSGAGEKPEVMAENSSINLSLNSVGDVLSTLSKQAESQQRQQLRKRSKQDVEGGRNSLSNNSIIPVDIDAAEIVVVADNGDIVGGVGEGGEVDDDTDDTKSVVSSTSNLNHPFVVNKSRMSTSSTANATGGGGGSISSGSGSSGGGHVPYLNSKFTYYLKESFGGNCKTIWITTVLGGIDNYQINLTSLNYATWAMRIRNTVSINRLNLNDISPNEKDPEILRLKRILEDRSKDFKVIHKTTVIAVKAEIERQRSLSLSFDLNESIGDGDDAGDGDKKVEQGLRPEDTDDNKHDFVGEKLSFTPEKQTNVSHNSSESPVSGSAKGSCPSCDRCADYDDLVVRLEASRELNEQQSDELLYTKATISTLEAKHKKELKAVIDSRSEVEDKLAETRSTIATLSQELERASGSLQDALDASAKECSEKVCKLHAAEKENDELSLRCKALEAQLAERDKRLTELTDKQITWNNERVALEESVSDLRDQLSCTQGSKDDLHSQLQQLQHDLNRRLQEVDEMQSALSKSQEAEKDTQTALLQKKVELADILADNQKLRHDGSELAAKNAQSSIEIQTLKESMANAQRVNQAEITRLNAVIASQQAELAESSRLLLISTEKIHTIETHYTKQIERYTSVISTYEEKIITLQTEITTIVSAGHDKTAEEVVRLNDVISGLQKEIRELKTLLEGKDNQISLLKTTIEETTQKLTTTTETLTMRVAGHKTRETQLSSEISAIVEREKTLLTRVEEYSQMEAQYTAKENKLTARISELETQLHNKSSVINSLLDKSAAIGTSLTELTSVKDREINGLKQRVSDLDIRLTTALTENDKLSKEKSQTMHEFESQIAALIQSLQNTTNALKTLQSQHAHLQQQHSDYVRSSIRELSAANDRVTLTIDTLSRKAGEVRTLQEECNRLRAQLTPSNSSHQSRRTSVSPMSPVPAEEQPSPADGGSAPRTMEGEGALSRESV